MTNADLPHQGRTFFQFFDRQAGAQARYSHHALAQGNLGRLGHDRAVQTPGEGHGATTETPQEFEQAVALGGKIGGKKWHRQIVLRRNAVAMGF